MSTVDVVRGGVVESRHVVHLAVCDAEGGLLTAIGDPDALTFYRSAAKPLQALPLVEEGVADRLGLSVEELALCCASHEGEPRHVEGARSILRKAGVDESVLRCGPHAPYARAAAEALLRAGESPARIHNNCSGKHAGMIALAIGMGWDPLDYHLPDHPVQRRMIDEVVRWSGLAADEIPVAVDGCGVVCFAVPLRSMARSFASFTSAADAGAPAGRIVDAMTAHPFMVGGTGRACTAVMEVAGDRTWVKLGAEGVYGGGLRGRGIGFAIKVADGGRRAVEVALIRVLRALDALTDEQVERLRAHGNPTVRNTRDEAVGEVRAAFEVVMSASGSR
ncbi:MAG: asparaginase [Gemmatimonadota bacterium]|nr:asparaginase [Gemmatimonadota bacterium]